MALIAGATRASIKAPDRIFSVVKVTDRCLLYPSSRTRRVGRPALTGNLVWKPIADHPVSPRSISRPKVIHVVLYESRLCVHTHTLNILCLYTDVYVECITCFMYIYILNGKKIIYPREAKNARGRSSRINICFRYVQHAHARICSVLVFDDEEGREKRIAFSRAVLVGVHILGPFFRGEGFFKKNKKSFVTRAGRRVACGKRREERSS